MFDVGDGAHRGGGLKILRLPLLYLAVIFAPVAFLLAVQTLSDDELEGVTSDPMPVLTKAAERELLSSQAVSLTLEWSLGRDVLAPAWHGTVQAVLVAPPDTLISGQRVATIDGLARIAFATPVAFYRALRWGDSGADVEQLHVMLRELGFLNDEPAMATVYDRATYDAVYALEAALGASQPTGQFDPGLVVWLPASPFEVASVQLKASAPAPPAGQAVASERLRLTGARASASQPDTPLIFEPGVQYVLVVEGERFPFDSSTATVPEEDMAALEAFAEPPSLGAEPTRPNSPEGSSGSRPGVVERAIPLSSRAIPSTAVMMNSAGALCVWVPERNDYSAVPVRVASSRAGVTDVIEGLDAGAIVLANPAQILADPSCPSN